MCQVVVVAIMIGNTIGLRSVMKRERRRGNEDGVRFERHGEEVRLSMSMWNKVLSG
jgi:hypothetical protein